MKTRMISMFTAIALSLLKLPESIAIACSAERAPSLDAVKICEILVEHYLAFADDQDPL